MKKLFFALVFLAAPAWGQSYGDDGAAVAVQASRDYENQLQADRQEQQIYQQQQQIQQMQQEQANRPTEYIPVYGDGTNPTQ